MTLGQRSRTLKLQILKIHILVNFNHGKILKENLCNLGLVCFESIMLHLNLAGLTSLMMFTVYAESTSLPGVLQVALDKVNYMT